MVEILPRRASAKIEETPGVSSIVPSGDRVGSRYDCARVQVNIQKPMLEHTSATPLASQRSLFDIPRDVAYFNCAYNSPQLNASRERLVSATRSHPGAG
jgi:hypothetical protein